MNEDLTGYENQLYHDRTLVKLWGQRGTLHVYDSKDWPLVIGSCGSGPTWSERSLAQQGGDVDKFHAIIDRIRKIAAEEGTVSRSILRSKGDIDWDVGVDVDLLSSWAGLFSQLVIEGTLCHGKPGGGEGRFAHRAHWLPDLEWSPPSTKEADTELARRYLHTFGPSTVQDYGYWRGIPMSRARVAIGALEDDVIEVECEGRELVIMKEDLPTLLEEPPQKQTWPVKMLYRFDPLLLGHKDKSWIIDMKYYDKVWIIAGHINGTILVGGKIQGTWKYTRKGKKLEIEVRPFRKFGKRLVRKVEREAKGVAGFFGVELGKVNWL